MNLTEANKIWKQVLEKLKSMNSPMIALLSNSKISSITNNIWDVEIEEYITPIFSSTLFLPQNQELVKKIIFYICGLNVKFNFYGLEKITDYGLDKDTFNQVSDYLEKHISSYTSNTIKAYSNLFFIVYELLDKKISVDSIIKLYFYFFKLHQIKYYSNDNFKSIYTSLANRIEVKGLTFAKKHILAFIFYHLLFEKGLTFKNYAYVEKIFNDKKKIMEFYDKCKKTDKYKLSSQYYQTSLFDNINNSRLAEALDELNSMIGLDNVKEQVNSLINFLKVKQLRTQAGLSNEPQTLHMIFSGNPGTGKTTVARILAKIYKELGIIKKGHFVEVDRGKLVGEYIGATAIKTKNVIDEALDGILFIDEAYSLTRDLSDRRDYGNEVIDTLVKAMEDNRDRLIVIAAGYTEFMEEFLKANPGLSSRFKNIIEFKNYNPAELFEIFTKMCNEHNYIVEPKAMNYLKKLFEEYYSSVPDNFSNGREIRNLFETIKLNQANRLCSQKNIDDKDLSIFKLVDVKDVLKVEKEVPKIQIGFVSN